MDTPGPTDFLRQKLVEHVRSLFNEGNRDARLRDALERLVIVEADQERIAARRRLWVDLQNATIDDHLPRLDAGGRDLFATDALLAGAGARCWINCSSSFSTYPVQKRFIRLAIPQNPVHRMTPGNPPKTKKIGNTPSRTKNGRPNLIWTDRLGGFYRETLINP